MSSSGAEPDRRSLPRPWLRRWHAWLVLALGIAATLATAWQVRREIQADTLHHFALECDQVVSRVEERLAAYALILRGAAGLFSASHDVTRADWRTYVETLQSERSVPGVQGIGFAATVPADQLQQHQAQLRAEGLTHYRVWPDDPRPEYTAIVYIEPFSGHNLGALGHDMLTEPARRDALQRARDNAEAALSGPLQLAQDGDAALHSGVMMALPVYRVDTDPVSPAQRRRALMGWTFSPYRMSDLMRGMLAGWAGGDVKTLALRVDDVTDAGAPQRLYDSRPGQPQAPSALLRQQRDLALHGRIWRLSFEDADASAAVDYGTAWLTLGTGLLLSGLLFALMRSVIHTRANADRIAQRLTEETRRRVEQVRESEAFKASILDSVLAEIAVLDRQGRIVAVNEPWRRARAGGRGGAIGDDYLAEHTLPEGDAGHAEALRTQAGIRAVLAGSAPQLYQELPRRAPAAPGWYALTITPLGPGGQGAVVSHTDISERRRAQDQMHLAASVFSHAHEGILITDLDGSIVDVNEAFTRITGYSRAEVLGRNPRLLKSGLQSAASYAALWRQLAAEGHWYGELWNRHKDGSLYVALQAISTVRDGQGQPRHFLSLFSDITALKAQESRLERIAHYDALTGLPNRVLLADRLRQAMQQARRRGQLLALVFLDLDGFKAINDAHGHALGDRMLVALSRRMQHAIRSADTLARLGGDEFVAVLGDLNDVAASVPLLQRVLAAAAQPVLEGGQALQVSASLGVSFYPQAEEVDAEQLIRQADQAMYQAKQAGRNRYVIFDADQDRSMRGHIEGLDRLRAALAADEFVLHFQPQVNMRTGAVVGAEALIRWQHPDEGLLLPARFLPLIERHRLSVDLGDWVIDAALAQFEAWQAQGITLPLSVNVGAYQVQQPDFVERLRGHLARHPAVGAGQLQLELLETSELNDLDQVAEVMRACAELGVGFALDDFGTGYSSLAYLKRLTAGQIKVDRSFVRDMLHEPEDLAILDGVMGLARAFQREVIAEGVESVELGRMLLRMGCELGQGYGIARPMPAQDMAAWLAQWRPPQDWAGVRPLRADERPLLQAGVEHRAWIRALTEHLQGRRRAPADLHEHQCRFGAWLAADGLALYGPQPIFLALAAAHRRVHEQGRELLALQARGDAAAAQAALPALEACSEALQRQLWALA